MPRTYHKTIISPQLPEEQDINIQEILKVYYFFSLSLTEGKKLNGDGILHDFGITIKKGNKVAKLTGFIKVNT